MLKEAFIPENTRNGFLFKLWNNSAAPFHREIINHRHLQFEVVLFKDGHGTYTSQTGTFDIEPNDVFVFSSNEQHCITDINGNGNLSFMNIHFEPRYVWGSRYNGFSSESANICFSHNDDFESRLPRNNPYTDKIRQILLEIEHELTEKSPEYELMVHNKVYEILVILARHLNYGQGKTVTAEEYGHIKAIRSAMDYINRHSTEELSLKDIAERVDLSPNYFSHIFKKTVGISLWDYVISKRIETAMSALSAQEVYNMLDIAVNSGFNNTANFNKAFRRVTGLTPTEFRRHKEYIG